MDSSVSTGAGKTGLLFSSAGLIISTAKIGDATPTVYTQAAGNIETITTLGTYAAPTASKCRFKEYDSTNHKGVYEIHIANARFASTTDLIISISGATDLAEQDIEIQIESITVTTNNDKTGYTASASNMRGTDSAALAATALSDAVWTAAKAAFLDASVTSRATPAQVKTQAKEVIFTDTISELTAGLLAVNPTPANALMAQYMKLRNIFKSGDAEQASQEWQIYNNAGVVIAKGTLSTAGSIFTKGIAVAP